MSAPPLAVAAAAAIGVAVGLVVAAAVVIAAGLAAAVATATAAGLAAAAAGLATAVAAEHRHWLAGSEETSTLPPAFAAALGASLPGWPVAENWKPLI